MVGPSFFLLLETSIKRGVKAAFAFDCGVLISDLIYILIAYLFFSEIASLTQGANEHLLKIIGGVLFIGYGTVTIFKKPKDQKVDGYGNFYHNPRDYIILGIKGFVLNIANPMVFLYWFTVMTVGVPPKTHVYVIDPMIVYLTVLLVTFFSIDILKILGAEKLRPFITKPVLISLNRIIGSILITFGVILLIQGILALL